MVQVRILRRLALMSSRDMLRDRLTGLAPIFLFVWLVVVYSALAIMLEDASTRPDMHPLRAAIPSILMSGIAAVGFMALAVPLVSMRERGLLRLLGTTPVKRSTFLVAQMPARLVLVALEAASMVTLARLAGFMGEYSNLWRLMCSLMIGTAMLFACAMVFAGRARSAEATHQGSTVLVLGLFIFSGSFLPPGVLPSFTQVVTNALPSSWFSVALGADLTGVVPFLPVPLLWAMMLAVTGVAWAIASRRFVWDPEERRSSTPVSLQQSTTKAMVST